MDQAKKPGFLLAQRADADVYPPVLHQAAILQKYGSVTLVDSGQSSHTQFLTHPGVVRVRIPMGPSGRFGVLGRLSSFIRFRSTLQRELYRYTDIAIAYEPDAAAVLLTSICKRNVFKVVHLHEHVEADGYSSSRISRKSLAGMLGNLDRANLIVVADRDRAKFLAELSGTSTRIVVVMNCPPLVRSIPGSRLIPLLASRGISSTSIVHYQGAVGPDHGLEVIIASMVHWPADALFTVVGRCTSSYRSELESLAGKHGVANRVVYIDRVPYDQVLSYAVGASVGLTLLDTSRSNWRFAAGASNKRFEYAALGIPQVTNTGPGVHDLFVEPGIATAVDASSPPAVGEAIARYLGNPALSSATGERARALHRSVYNYEHQFAPVLEKLLS